MISALVAPCRRGGNPSEAAISLSDRVSTKVEHPQAGRQGRLRRKTVHEAGRAHYCKARSTVRARSDRENGLARKIEPGTGTLVSDIESWV